MYSLKKRYDFISVIKYTFIFFIFLIFNNLEEEILPYSSAVLTTCLMYNCSLFLTPLLYLSAFIAMGETGLLGAGAIFVLIICPIILIYKRYGIKPKFEFVAFTLIGLLGFAFLGNTSKFITLDKRVLTVLLSTFLCFLSIISAKAICEKGLRLKIGFEEFFSVAVMCAISGLGVCNLASPFLWKGISIYLILFCCYISNTGVGSVISAVLGISLSLYYKDVKYVSIFLLYGVFSECFSKLSRYASSLSVLAIDYLMQVIFNVYSSYSYMHLASVLLGALCFSVTPLQIITSVKEKLSTFREKQLVRQTINRSRTLLSGKLYELSNVFAEMSNSFYTFKSQALNEDKAKNLMQKEILNSICKNCDNFIKCKKNEKAICIALNKLIDIGMAKGKLSLIDLPTELSTTCIHLNDILFALNKLLADYRARLIEKANLEVGRDLIAAEALGIAEILRSLALESGQLLKFNNPLEKELYDKLIKSGFVITELLLYGSENNYCVSLIICMQEFSVQEIEKIVSDTLRMRMSVETKNIILKDKVYISLKKNNDYDAVFGISKATKDGSNKSGDTYSTTKISDDKLLIALSDGMGSGEQSENISSTSLSLIESFYKAGLNENLILDTVNKLLTLNTEDFFTALDIAVINLKNCCVDFIKYGAPYGFIINENGIKIVEGNSLPLGIIEGLKPSIATTPLNDGDIVLLVTDGVSDAFNNSGALIDFLRTQPAKNPQSLTEEIINKALQLNQGQIKDDMTALAVRIFKKSA